MGFKTISADEFLGNPKVKREEKNKDIRGILSLWQLQKSQKLNTAQIMA